LEKLREIKMRLNLAEKIKNEICAEEVAVDGIM
jgi:hypothetical protein